MILLKIGNNCFYPTLFFNKKEILALTVCFFNLIFSGLKFTETKDKT